MIIVDSTIKHVRELWENIREKDKLEAERMGINPKKGLFQMYRRGVYRKTALIDGKVAAMWGVVGTPLSNNGHPYLLTSDEVYKISPLEFARVYKQEVSIMNELFPRLDSYVDASYIGACRLLRIAGFTLKGPVLENEHLFYYFYKDAE